MLSTTLGLRRLGFIRAAFYNPGGRIIACQQCPVVVARGQRSLASLSQLSEKRGRGTHRRSIAPLFVGIAAGSVLVAGSIVQSQHLSSKCEAVSSAQSSTPDDTTSSIAVTSADEGPDPYDSLPDEDEDTNCSMCRTFRQGPCRTFWRKLERCFKDHESEENGAAQCMRYFSPHSSCLAQYHNLYQLISLETKQDLVEDAEKAMEAHERRKWKVNDMDWSSWIEFVQENGPHFCQTIRDKKNASIPLWKRLPDETEPVLITVTANVPQVPPPDAGSNNVGDRLILKVAYAIDQDGYCLGLLYNTTYGNLVDVSQGKEPSEKDQEEAVPLDRPVPLEFFVLPGETKKVQLKALYAENPTHVPDDQAVLEALLYESSPRSLKKAARLA